GAPRLCRRKNCAPDQPLNKGRKAAVRGRFADRARYAALRKSILRPPVRVWWLCRTRLMLSCATAPSHPSPASGGGQGGGAVLVSWNLFLLLFLAADTTILGNRRCDSRSLIFASPTGLLYAMGA